MSGHELEHIYQRYLSCLNERDWPRLGHLVHPHVHHNGRPLGLDGYRAMLENDVEQIPDLVFTLAFLFVEPPRLAARLLFDVTPKGEFLGLAINGRKVAFAENVFYEFEEGRIREVWSVIDKIAIEAQLA